MSQGSGSSSSSSSSPRTQSARYVLYLDFQRGRTAWTHRTAQTSTDSLGSGSGAGSSSGSAVGSGSGSGSAAPTVDVIPVSSMSMHEGYSHGWIGQATVLTQSTRYIELSSMLVSAISVKAVPGAPVMLRLVYNDGNRGPNKGPVVRTWPCVITSVHPFQGPDDPRVAGFTVELADPLSYLASRPVWGAYRAASVGEMLGGAMSLAAGGDGKPTLTPVLPNMPRVRITGAYRPEAHWLPYSIAAGETLGQWINELFAITGIRAEMRGSRAGFVTITLTDRPSAGRPVPVTLLGSKGDLAGTSTGAKMYITAATGDAGKPWRGGVLDDPKLGAFQRFGVSAGIGTLETGEEIGLDEAVKRSTFPTIAANSEGLTLRAISRQPGLRPSRRVRFNEAYISGRNWDVTAVRHFCARGVYDNDVVLCQWTSRNSWHPRPPVARAPRYISAVVDGGDDATYLEPVDRDGLGRIPVALSFLPSPIGEEAVLLALADEDEDGTLTLDDFTADEEAAYERDIAEWRTKDQTWESGGYDDPYPGKRDSELTADELADRKAKRQSRLEVLRYRAWRMARARDLADRDRDGEISDRDVLVGDTLATILRNDSQRATLAAQWASYKAGTLATDYPGIVQSGGNVDPARLNLIRQYGALFDPTWAGSSPRSAGSGAGSGAGSASSTLSGSASGSGSGGGTSVMSGSGSAGGSATAGSGSSLGSGMTAGSGSASGSGSGVGSGLPFSDTHYRMAQRDAEVADQKWPVRIPLTIIEPMASAEHGFAPAHRHGDVCRIAVHHPLWAEIVGFQYRADRRVNPVAANAAAGLLVEHDQRYSYSGIVFMPITEPKVTEPTTINGSGSG